MSTLKKCKDCKWSRIGWIEKLILGWKMAKCHHPKIGPKIGDTDYSTGVKEPDDWWFCATMRNGDYDPEKYCGPQARYFENEEERKNWPLGT